MIASVKAALSQFHLNSAAHFASMCAEIEKEEKHLEWPQPRMKEARSNALAAVLLAAASLEASINEFYQLAIDKSEKALEPLTPNQISSLAERWPHIEMKSPIRKYETALILTEHKSMNTGQEPYRSAKGLMDLRNALIHFKPEWDDDLKKHGKLERQLSQLFPASALSERANREMVWFPKKCLGAGCAEWAVESAVRFSQEFVKILGIRELLKSTPKDHINE